MNDLSFVWLEISGKCQLHCNHCYADSGPDGTDGAMTLEDWASVIDQAAGLGTKMVQFIGGEGFLAVFRSMFHDPGFYVMDEPESALSFTACLQLVALMYELGEAGAQVVCATHSPILASMPGADIIEVGEHGLRRVKWVDLQLVDHWRRYLDNPGAYLRHLTVS